MLWLHAAQPAAERAGFFLPHYHHKHRDHMERLLDQHANGSLRIIIDSTRFEGIESVPAAVEHLQKGASAGKVVVFMDGNARSRPSSRRARM